MRRTAGLVAIFLVGLAGSIGAQGSTPLLKDRSVSRPSQADTLAADIAAHTTLLSTPAVQANGSVRDSVRRELIRLRHAARRRDRVSCSDRTKRFQWCGFSLDPATAKAAGQLFWDQEEDDGLVLGKMLNIQGLGDYGSQSTYVELVADLWNMARISLAGVVQPKDEDSEDEPDPAAGGESSEKEEESKAQHFLNGGGPAVVTLLRPFFSSNLIGWRSVLLGRAQGSFSLPAAGQSARDSLKFATFGLDLQSQIQGVGGRIGGLVTFHVGQIVGSNRFYNSVGEDKSFMIANASLGLVIDQAVSISWTRFIRGPALLKNPDGLISVKFTR